MLVILLGELSWPILERIRLVGDLAISPHGLSIALGFLVGAQLMLRQAQRRGVARRPIQAGEPDVAETISAFATRGAIGTILGARFFYVVTRLDSYPDPLEWFQVWEGGLSLLGGITGGILACMPYVVRRRLSIPLLFDSLAPGLAAGIFIGRIGDLVIGEHLGGPTDFVLGWRCSGQFDDPAAPYEWVRPTVQGCFDRALHQTALYDFLAAGVVLAALLALTRRPRFDGFFLSAFVLLYGTGRFVSDFARAADRDLVPTLGLTGSQVAALLAITAVLVFLALKRPWRARPWAWSPPDFSHRWGRRLRGEPPGDQADGGPGEGQDTASSIVSASGERAPDGP